MEAAIREGVEPCPEGRDLEWGALGQLAETIKRHKLAAKSNRILCVNGLMEYDMALSVTNTIRWRLRIQALLNVALVFVMVLMPAYTALSQTKGVVQLVKKTRTAVVLISVKDAFGIERGQGTGFFINPTDIITNHHVVKGAASISVQTHDSTRFDVKRIVAIDTVNDLALVRLDKPAGKHAGTLQLDEQVPELGEKVYVIGNPLGFDQTVSDGIVAGVRRIEDVSETIQFTAPISSGSSGSPLLNDQGRVIGVVRSSFSDGQNLNFATPSKFIATLDTLSTVEFTTSSKMFMGKLMNIREAFTVAESLDEAAPTGLSVREYNVWLLKQVSKKHGWNDAVVDAQGSRLYRLAKRFAEKDIEEDSLDKAESERIVREALGIKGKESNPTKEVDAKKYSLSIALAIASRALSLQYGVKTTEIYQAVLQDQHQEFVEMETGKVYVLYTTTDDCARDIDVALFRKEENIWKPVASDTDNDAHPIIVYVPPSTERYAVVWKLARKWRTCEEVQVGAILMTTSE